MAIINRWYYIFVPGLETRNYFCNEKRGAEAPLKFNVEQG